MDREYLIGPCAGIAAEILKGQIVTVIDAEGGQVADFFCGNGGKSRRISFDGRHDRLQ